VGVSEQPLGYCGIVGASTLELDDPLGEVDLDRTLDGGRWCLELPCAMCSLGRCARTLGLCGAV
jgi:hypothetical protein